MAQMDGVDADQLLKKADMALYAAKNGGGCDHRFFALRWRKQRRKGARSNSTCAKPWLRSVPTLLPATGRFAHRPRDDLRSIDALETSKSRHGAIAAVPQGSPAILGILPGSRLAIIPADHGQPRCRQDRHGRRRAIPRGAPVLFAAAHSGGRASGDQPWHISLLAGHRCAPLSLVEY